MAISAVTVAVRAVKTGMSARAGLLAARAAGVAVRDATWFRIVGEVQRSLANQIREVGLPLNRRPIGDEISTFTTKKATGFVQYVDVYVRDRQTGLVSRRPYAVRTSALLTRQAIIGRAVNAFQSFTSGPEPSYPEQVLGANYTATYRMTPGLGDTGSAPGSVPTASESAVRGAYQSVAGNATGSFQRIADVRAQLDAQGISRAEQNSTLTNMVRAGTAHVAEMDQPRFITPSDQAAAFVFGGRSTYLIYVP